MRRNNLSKFTIFAARSGCSAVGSARRSGRRGRWFESSHPDFFLATLAQLVEQLIRNEQVVGSSPISGSTKLHRQLFLFYANRLQRYRPYGISGRVGLSAGPYGRAD